MNNICNQGDSSVEKQLLCRQSVVKTVEKSSWFCETRKILWKYDLPDIEDLVIDSYQSKEWKRLVYKRVNEYWVQRIENQLTFYESLRFMKHEEFIPGHVLPVIGLELSAREADRLHSKLKLLTGTYILQTTRAHFNQYEVNPTCLLCKESQETVEHFILECPSLDIVRQSIINDVENEATIILKRNFYELTPSQKVQVIINCWPSVKKHVKNRRDIYTFEYHCGRLLHALHNTRISMLKKL